MSTESDQPVSELAERLLPDNNSSSFVFEKLSSDSDFFELEQAADEAEAEGLLQEEIFIDGTEVEGQSSEKISVDENGNLSVAVPGPEDFEAQEGGAGDGI